MKTYGEKIFDEFVTTLYDLGQLFSDLIVKDPDFELTVTPMTNTVCFRFIDASLNQEELNTLNAAVRQQLLEDGEFYIV